MEASGCMFLSHSQRLYTELTLLAWRRRRVLPAACTVLPDFVCGFLVEKELDFNLWLTKELHLPGGGGVCCASSVSRSAASGVRSRDSGTRAAAS